MHLIDTPGFNDTNAKDGDILQEIAFFLTKLYEERIELAGVIFLHRITDQRMSGASIRNLRILQWLCGESSMPHLALVSTMWGNLQDKELGISRERDLLQNANFWAPMQASGAIISRHDGSVESARDIVEALIQRGSTVLDLQREMVDQDLKLDETTVGKYLQEEMLEARKKHEKELAELEEALKEALEDSDQSLVEVLTEQRKTQVQLLSKHKAEHQGLHVSSGNLNRERSVVLSELKVQLAKDDKKREDEIHALRAQIESLQDDLVGTQVSRSRDLSKALRDRENLIVHNNLIAHSAETQQSNSEHQIRALKAQLAVKGRELQEERRQEKSTWMKNFLQGLFAFENDPRNDGMAFGNTRRSSSSRHSSHKLPRRSTHPAQHEPFNGRTFRSNGTHERN